MLSQRHCPTQPSAAADVRSHPAHGLCVPLPKQWAAAGRRFYYWEGLELLSTFPTPLLASAPIPSLVSRCLYHSCMRGLIGTSEGARLGRLRHHLLGSTQGNSRALAAQCCSALIWCSARGVGSCQVLGPGFKFAVGSSGFLRRPSALVDVRCGLT